MNTEEKTRQLCAQIEANEIWAVLLPKKAKRLLKANKAMTKEVLKLNPMPEELKYLDNMTDEELLNELEK